MIVLLQRELGKLWNEPIYELVNLNAVQIYDDNLLYIINIIMSIGYVVKTMLL